MSADFDIFVIGGGINGCGIARDAAGRGFSVALCEMNDLASGTSSNSTKLIHGGLRYLEHYEFRLVRKALSEREILWGNAPHIIWPLRFVLPYHNGLRPAWLLRMGLFIYDYIGGRRRLPPTKTLNLKNESVGDPLKPLFSKAFEYSDCWVNDSRLVVLNAQDAANRGAVIETHTQCISAERNEGIWNITTKNLTAGQTITRTAKLIINAAGPWVDDVIRQPLHTQNAHNVRLVQGSHIVVPKIFGHDKCYIFQNKDDRIIFAIPYEQDYTLIGTTDQDYNGDPGEAQITPREITYLCNAASEYFAKPVLEANVVWTYSGVRPLFDDGASKAQEATRDYMLRRDGIGAEAPVINIFGGKITTYRKLSESVLEMIEVSLGKRQPAWTVNASLPGGDFPIDGFPKLFDEIQRKYPFLTKAQSERLARAYGTIVFDIFGNAEEFGHDFGHGLSEKEVTYLMDNEWAKTPQDVIWRRTKLGIRFNTEQVRSLDIWMQNRQFSQAASDGR
jgi:glycerol-3-phosphate dehydrogenase